jgi:hypothetical protein
MAKLTTKLAFVASLFLCVLVVFRPVIEMHHVSSKLLTERVQGLRNNGARVVDFSPVAGDEIYEKMSVMGASRSMDHYRKFIARKEQVPERFHKASRYQPVVKKYAAIKVSKHFALLHIWKCGGTTVEYLTSGEQMHLDKLGIQKRQWLALLRDPIERFLSAWAECGVRLYEGEINFKGGEKHSSLKWLEGEYDFRVRAFLREVKGYLPPSRSCHTHAFPQANYMLNSTGHIDEHVRFVGDLSEMRMNLQIAGLRLGQADAVGRDADENLVKKYYFPSQQQLLSDETLLELCEFYSMDYFLFDFTPPEICVQPGGPLESIF